MISRRFATGSGDLIWQETLKRLLNRLAKRIMSRAPETVISVPTPDHHLLLPYVLAKRQHRELISFPIEGVGVNRYPCSPFEFLQGSMSVSTAPCESAGRPDNLRCRGSLFVSRGGVWATAVLKSSRTYGGKPAAGPTASKLGCAASSKAVDVGFGNC